jgi:hypothetical protein
VNLVRFVTREDPRRVVTRTGTLPKTPTGVLTTIFDFDLWSTFALAAPKLTLRTPVSRTPRIVTLTPAPGSTAERRDNLFTTGTFDRLS